MIPKNERDRLMMQSVEDGQVNLGKKGQLLEEAALKHQLARTKSKNVPLVTEPPKQEVCSVDLSELQAKLRKLEQEYLETPDKVSQQPPANPGTWVDDQQTPQATPTPAAVSTESQWKPLPTPKTRKRPRHRKRKPKMETIPEKAALTGDNLHFMINLSTDHRIVLFGLGVLFLLGTTVLVIHMFVSCFRRIWTLCQRNCGRYKLAETNSDRVTPAEWELQELNFV